MGLKVNFDTYSYNNPFSKYNGEYKAGDKRLNSKVDLSFNQSKLEGFVARGEYDKAVEYAEQYRMEGKDAQKRQAEWENYIEILRYNGRIANAEYAKLDKTREKPLVQFYDNVFANGTLDKIQDNEVVDKFNKLKRDLGSVGGKDGEATRLSLSFAPKTRTLFGLDWLAPDNDNTFEAFLERTGFSEQELNAQGIRPERIDGNIVITFDKSHPYANKLLANVSHYSAEQNDSKFAGFWLNEPTKITSYNSKGKKLLETKNISGQPALYNYIIGDTNQAITNRLVGRNLEDIQNLIADGKEMRDRLQNKEGLLVRDYSSTIGAPLDDAILYLNNLRNNGQIDDKTYYKEYKKQAGWIEDLMNVIGSSDIEIFTNTMNEDVNDSVLKPLEGSDLRQMAVTWINHAKPEKVHYNSMISNGRVGILITIGDDSTKEDSEDFNKTLDKRTKRRRDQFFIPADSMPTIMEKCQQSINKNSTTMAAREINAMQDYNYSYKLKNGTEIAPDGQGQFYRNGNINDRISKQEAESHINKDMIIRQASRELKYKFMNTRGNIFDVDGYEDAAKRIAVNAAIELNYGTSFMDENGVNLETNSASVSDMIDKIFSKKGVGSVVSSDYIDNLQYDVAKKYQDVYEIYDEIMNELRYYYNIKQ